MGEGPKKLSDAAISTLKELARFPITASGREPCLSALGRKGLASFHSGAGRTYSRDLWHISDAGRAHLAALTRATNEAGDDA